MRKIVKLLSIASVLGLLVGCGGGGSSSGDEDVGRNTSIEENESTEENESIGDTKVTSCWPDICTDEDFDNIRSNVKGNYTLKNDIDLSKYAGWEPIGNESVPFTGILNGGKHTIKGLTFKSYNNAKHVGLFGYISGADIEDLTVQTTNPITIELSSSDTYQSFGVLAGYANVSKIAKVTVYSSEPLAIEEKGSANLYVGGVVGYDNGKSSGLSVYSSLIKRAASQIAINATSNKLVYVGGIAGFSGGDAVIDNSYAEGYISVDGKASIYAGGIVGYIEGYQGKVSNSYASGAILAISGGAAKAGGIAGSTTGVISTSVALNPSVRAINTNNGSRFASRIANNYDSLPKYENDNFALDINPIEQNSILNFAPRTDVTSNANGRDGESKTLEQLSKQDTYDSGVLSWSFDGIWKWDVAKGRPVL